MNIVAVQLDIVWENRPANHEHVRELLKSVEIPAGSLIVLPEMFDSGFSMNPKVTAQSPARESESFLRALAKEYQAAVLGGVVGPLLGEQASNLAVAFSSDGTELTRYQKMQPFTPLGEQQHYGAGNAHAIFPWKQLHIAPMICYDLRFPEVFRPAAQEGAELFCVIASWPEKRSMHWVRLLQARAIENQAYVLGVNRCGSDPGLSYDGRTVLFDPMGEAIFELDRHEQVVQAEVSADVVRRWRGEFPALRDIRNLPK